jgi:hypothetical protein
MSESFFIWQVRRIMDELREAKTFWGWTLVDDIGAADKAVAEVIRRHEAALQALFARE